VRLVSQNNIRVPYNATIIFDLVTQTSNGWFYTYGPLAIAIFAGQYVSAGLVCQPLQHCSEQETFSSINVTNIVFTSGNQGCTYVVN
jgi:alkylated DNA nucleotide flippase Atl1